MDTLSLSLAWKESIKQWTWIVKQLNEGSLLSVHLLKREWMLQNDYAPSVVSYKCFLCEYDLQNRTPKNFCTNCPACIADSNLKRCWCQSLQYHYSSKPEAFLAKLEEVYAVWLKQH